MAEQVRISATATRTGLMPTTEDDQAGRGTGQFVRDVLAGQLSKTVEELIGASPVEVQAIDRLDWGCVLGTEHATAATAEFIAQTLTTRGPRWLDPDTFLFYSPHALTSEVARISGLAGPGVTLRGPASGVDALGYGADLIAGGRCSAVIVIAVEALTAWAAARTGQRESAERFAVAALLLTLGGDGPAVTDWSPGGNTAARAEPAIPRLAGPLLALAESCRHGRAGRELVQSCGSRVVIDHGPVHR